MKDSKKIKNVFYFFDETIKSLDIKEEIINVNNINNFLHIFSKVNDSRVKGRCKYKLDRLLIIVFLAKLTGNGSNALEIEEFCHIRKEMLQRYDILLDDNIPSHDTFRRLFMILDYDSLKEVFIDSLSAFFKKIEKKDPSNSKKVSLLSIDGKEFRGSGRKDNTKTPSRNLATLNVYNASNGICLESEVIEVKESEIDVSRQILKDFDLNKVLLTADALHCQKKTAELVIEKGGDYLFTVKDNQASLKEDILSRTKTSKAIVKKDKRTFIFKRLTKDYDNEFPYSKMYIKTINNTNNEELCFISSSISRQLIIDGINSRWSIESDLHKYKDLILDEDYVRYRNNKAIKNLALINNIILVLLKITKSITKSNALKNTPMYYQEDPVISLSKVIKVFTSDELIHEIEKQLKSKKK